MAPSKRVKIIFLFNSKNEYHHTYEHTPHIPAYLYSYLSAEEGGECSISIGVLQEAVAAGRGQAHGEEAQIARGLVHDLCVCDAKMSIELILIINRIHI